MVIRYSNSTYVRTNTKGHMYIIHGEKSKNKCREYLNNRGRERKKGSREREIESVCVCGEETDRDSETETEREGERERKANRQNATKNDF